MIGIAYPSLATLTKSIGNIDLLMWRYTLRSKSLPVGIDFLDGEDVPPERAVAETKRLANTIKIDAKPKTQRRHSAAAPLRFIDSDELASLTSTFVDKPKRFSGAVWPVVCRKEIMAVSNALSIMAEAVGDSWGFLGSVKKLDELAQQGYPLIFVGSTKLGGPTQGMLACARSLVVWCDNTGVTTIDYTIRAELIYVVASARRKRLAAALTAAACLCVREDFEQLCLAWRRCNTEAFIQCNVRGDAYSIGGERAFQSLFSTLELEIEFLNGEIPIEAVPDWSV